MSPWVAVAALLAIGLVWLELRRPNRARLSSRILAALAVAAAMTALLLAPGGAGRLTVLTPGAPLTARSREGVPLDQVQSVASFAARHPVLRLAGWGLLSHEWPDTVRSQVGFERTALPFGITQLDPPTEVGVGERLVVRGAATLGQADSAWITLEDPAGPRDSALVTREAPEFLLGDRPRAPGPVPYRLRLRGPGLPEVAETLGVAVQEMPLPAVLILDASPSFETAFLKRWLGNRGARVTVRTEISRGRFRTERLNDAGGNIAQLTPAVLGRYDAMLADGGSVAALSPRERSALDRQVREQGLGLLITADVPALLARGTCGLVDGFSVGPIAAGVDSAGGQGEHRVAKPTWAEAPRRSRTGIEAEAASLKPGGVEALIRDESGRIVAGRRTAGGGWVALTLLRTPSRWILEGEPDLFATYWHTLLRAVARDTVTRVMIAAEGPIRADQPVTVTLRVPSTEFQPPMGPGSLGTWNSKPGVPSARVVAPSGGVDTLALAQDPFDPARWTGRYWPRTAGWHRLELRGKRIVPFRVTYPTEWMGLEASARLAATTARLAGVPGHAAAGGLAFLWLRPAMFAVLLTALSWLWVEPRLGVSRGG
jgi:hypothetical protein